MSKLEIEISDEQIRSLHRIAEPLGVEAENFVARLVKDVLNPLDESGAVEVTLRAKILSVQLRQDQAILLVDFLQRLDLGEAIPRVTGERSVRIDKVQADVLDSLRRSLEDELPDEFGGYVEHARACAEREENWLDVKEIECSGCGEQLGWQLWSPFHGSMVLHCDGCPRTVEVSNEDPVYEEIDLDVSSDEGISEEELLAEREKRIEEQLAACLCGGAFRFEAARRCLYCAEPVARQPRDVGRYVDRVVSSSRKGRAVGESARGPGIWRS